MVLFVEHQLAVHFLVWQVVWSQVRNLLYLASPKNCFNLACTLFHPIQFSKVWNYLVFSALLGLPSFSNGTFFLLDFYSITSLRSTYFFSLPKSSKIIYPNIGCSWYTYTTTVQTQKQFHEIIYNTSLNGRIYPSYARKTQNLDRHITHSANNTDGYICQRIQTYLKK